MANGLLGRGNTPLLSPTGGTGGSGCGRAHQLCPAGAGASRAGTDPRLGHARFAAKAFLRHGSFVPGKQPIMTTEAKMPIKAVLGATSASLANVSPAPGAAGLKEGKTDQPADWCEVHLGI